jgi:hypothetical protein
MGRAGDVQSRGSATSQLRDKGEARWWFWFWVSSATAFTFATAWK